MPNLEEILRKFISKHHGQKLNYQHINELVERLKPLVKKPEIKEVEVVVSLDAKLAEKILNDERKRCIEITRHYVRTSETNSEQSITARQIHSDIENGRKA